MAWLLWRVARWALLMLLVYSFQFEFMHGLEDRQEGTVIVLVFCEVQKNGENYGAESVIVCFDAPPGLMATTRPSHLGNMEISFAGQPPMLTVRRKKFVYRWGETVPISILPLEKADYEAIANRRWLHMPFPELIRTLTGVLPQELPKLRSACATAPEP